MKTIRITKEFSFEAAHILDNYDGLCRHIHGHSYKLFVCIKGGIIDEVNNPKNGMLLDFLDLKKIISEEIIKKFDHSLMLKKGTVITTSDKSNDMLARIIYTDFQPTCENLVFDFACIIRKKLPVNIQLFSLKLYETASSYAEWYADDNN